MALPVWPFQGFRPWVKAILLMAGFPVLVLAPALSFAQEAVSAGSVAVTSSHTASSVSGGSGPAIGPAAGGGAMQILGFIVAILLLLGAGLILFYRGNGGWGALGGWRPGARGVRKLNVEETRALGQRQFLAVVEYEGRKMLLGVCPGRIDYLCPLDGMEGSEGDKMDFQQLIPSAADAAGNAKQQKEAGQ